MIILPAIDIISGQAVRLVQGDYEKKTVYSDSPVAVASEFANAGAAELHIVDLDGAKSGGCENLTLISSIAKIPGLKIEVGGGIRTREQATAYLFAGAERVILGSALVDNPLLAKQLALEFPERIVAGVDASGGKLAIHGWKTITDIDAVEYCRSIKDIGISTVIYTDISKDGMLKGCDFDLYSKLTAVSGLNIIASGGVSSLADIATLKNIGVYGCILGKALYTGRINLKDALKAAR